MTHQQDNGITTSPTTSTTVEQSVIGVLGDTYWDSVTHIEDFITEVMENDEEVYGEEALSPRLVVRQTGTTGAEDLAMHIAEKHKWDVTCTKIPDAKTALKQMLKETDVVMVFLKHGTKSVIPEKTLREMQETEPKLRIKLA